MKILYSASVTATKGGRIGHVTSSDGQLSLNLAMPKALGGPGGEGTNPEQLFAAGYSACFHSALGLVARTKKISIKDYEVTAHVSIGEDSLGGFALETIMDVKIPEVASDVVKDLIESAHQVCPYSKATRGNMNVTFHVIN
ncbi:organic hydroperoxide resistance protein [Brevibacillus sp. M2.1A]|uniref:organic hydroperoxide resistance protein n=1 Tax=Brevibacillus sp. M2.1A TaxID=2738980 RepID=UPI00156B3A04|nr:organic hydroperoxide resistance protein [Brevibacillus sp. M2.1A]MCC8438547.1 organic hydroperoxide resistance protein [Brevibacillus sp. M2.1A]